MRLENGMRFDRCVGLQDRDALDGKLFDANVLTCQDKPLSAGQSIRVGGRAYRYDGDDNLGNSIFTPLEPFPEFETVEKPYKDNLFVVLEIYPMKNGHFYVWPYVQSGATSSGHYTRQGFQFKGEFETRELAIEAGWGAGKERIDALYSSYESVQNSVGGEQRSETFYATCLTSSACELELPSKAAFSIHRSR